MPKLIVIAGPTASGKTTLAVELAKELSCPILSADSRQCYKEMSIGTAKPSKEEQSGRQHYFINSHSIKSPLSSGRFETEALNVLDELFKNNEYVILVGGSGMFINALLYGTDQLPYDKKTRNALNEKYESTGLEPLLEELKESDPVFYEKVDRHNPVRVIRALEVIRISGKPYSLLRSEKTKNRSFKTDYFVIQHDRETLYKRINKRVDIMMDQGLLNEVKSLLNFRDQQPLNTVGYKELFEYLDGATDLKTAVESIKRNTRRYAKRQLTWFRKDTNCKWIEYDKTAVMVEKIKQHI